MKPWKLIFIVCLFISPSTMAQCGTSTADVTFDECIVENSANTPWRFLGRANGTCPTVQGWNSRQLFQPAGNADLPPGLEGFCVYEDVDLPRNMAGLMNAQCDTGGDQQDCLVQLDPDSASVAVMGGETAELIWQNLREQFLNQVDPIEPLPNAGPNIRLAILDTEPTGNNQDRNGAGISQHGFTLLNMVRDMICPVTGSCGVQLKSRLALPLSFCDTNDAGLCRDPAAGGYLGTIGGLAAAVRAEVVDLENGSIDRLILNLSVAWDPFFGDDDPLIDSPVAVQAMYRALQDARCRGALVIAAAGNRVTGPTTNRGPLLPGGWEEAPAPNQATCQTLLGFNPPAANFFGNYHPLVYAAGAVNAKNTPSETRLFGEPRLTAYGDHAVSQINDVGIPAPTQILTGSSVASVVVSASAAAAWYYASGRSSDQLMDDVYASGEDLIRTAEFCVGGPPCSSRVHKISICPVVDKVCESVPGGSCPMLACNTENSIIAALPAEAIADLFVDAAIESLENVAVARPLNECRPGYVLYEQAGVTAADPCPHLQYFGAQATPWTDGQPEHQFCPTCNDTYQSPGKLYLEVDDSLDGTLSQITLLCGEEAYSVAGTLVAGDKLVIAEIPEHCEFESVAVAYRLDNDTGSPASVASPSILIADRDNDGVQDTFDNCSNITNPLQIDADNDGYGNYCDGDFDQNCQTNFIDLAAMVDIFLGNDDVIDMNSDGVVNFLDFSLFVELFLQPPGPSSVGGLCDTS